MTLSTSPTDLLRQLGTAQAPRIIDVCIPEDVAHLPLRLPGSVRVAHGDIAEQANQFDTATPIVVVCQKGLKLSHGAAALLRNARHSATALDGGVVAWQANARPTIAEGAQHKHYALPCPAGTHALFSSWLIQRWIAPEAHFLWVPSDMCAAVADRFGAKSATDPIEIADAVDLTWPPLIRFLSQTDAPWTALLSAVPRLHPTPEAAFAAALPIIDAAWTALRTDVVL
ncbi:MAG: rhodanese-like domain-containing protein [Pseudomonadota bacterium]